MELLLINYDERDRNMLELRVWGKSKIYYTLRSTEVVIQSGVSNHSPRVLLQFTKEIVPSVRTSWVTCAGPELKPKYRKLNYMFDLFDKLALPTSTMSDW